MPTLTATTHINLQHPKTKAATPSQEPHPWWWSQCPQWPQPPTKSQPPRRPQWWLFSVAVVVAMGIFYPLCYCIWENWQVKVGCHCCWHFRLWEWRLRKIWLLWGIWPSWWLWLLWLLYVQPPHCGDPQQPIKKCARYNVKSVLHWYWQELLTVSFITFSYWIKYKYIFCWSHNLFYQVIILL